MVPIDELKRIATTRLGDAKVLLRNNRHDGAGYMCGYAIELALKARVCQARNWEGQPESEQENPSYKVLKTHDLDTLLQQTTIHREIKSKHMSAWSIMRTWNPELRYHRIGSVSRADAEGFIRAAEILLKVLIW